MKMMRPVGWRYESARHSLAARGIPTGRRYSGEKTGPWLKTGSVPTRSTMEHRIQNIAAAARRTKDIGVFEPDRTMTPRDEVELYILNAAKSKTRAGAMLLRYRDMVREAKKGRSELPMIEENVKKIMRLEQEIPALKELEGPRSEDAAKKKVELAALKALVASQLSMSKRTLREYVDDLQRVAISESNRQAARKEMLERAKRSILRAAAEMTPKQEGESFEEHMEGQRALLEYPRPEIANVFGLVEKNVAVGQVSPEYGVSVKKAYALSTEPKDLARSVAPVKVVEESAFPAVWRIPVKTRAAPQLMVIEKNVARGDVMPEEGLQARREYVRDLRRALHATTLKPKEFTGQVALPVTKENRSLQDLEWFARKRRSARWLV